MKAWIATHKDTLAVVISIIALLGTWIPFWWRDLRTYNRVDAMIISFWAEESATATTEVVYINMGNRPAAITDVILSMKLRLDANADPNDIRYKTELQMWRGVPQPFTLLPGQIVTQSYHLGEKNIDLSKMGPPNSVLDYYLNFHVMDSAGRFHSVRTLLSSTTIGEDVSNSARGFPVRVRLLPSPSVDTLPRFPRKFVDRQQ